MLNDDELFEKFHIKKPILNFKKSCYKTKKNRSYHELSIVLDRYTQNIEKGKGFNYRKKVLIEKYSTNNILLIIDSYKWIRPFVDLCVNDDNFFKNIGFEEVIKHISLLISNSRKKHCGIILLREFINLFFYRYGEIESSLFFIDFLKNQLLYYKDKSVVKPIENLRRDCNEIISKNGCLNFLKYVSQNKMSLIDSAKEYDIQTNTRFYLKAQSIYYVEEIKKLKPNEYTDLFKELENKEIYNVKMTNVSKKWTLGHEVIKILIQKLIDSSTKPEEIWTEFILNVAGDPRCSRDSMLFLAIWNDLEKNLLNQMIQWLSDADLRLFLEVFRDFSYKSNDASLKRMYPARERFLKSIFRKNIIKNTRLYLSSDAISYIESKCKNIKNFYYTELKGISKFAGFYINLGNAHILEGTSNFRLHIFDKIPENSFLRKYNAECSMITFRSDTEKEYYKQFKNSSNYRGFTHDPSGNWIDKSIEFLQSLNINIVKSDIIKNNTGNI